MKKSVSLNKISRNPIYSFHTFISSSLLRHLYTLSPRLSPIQRLSTTTYTFHTFFFQHRVEMISVRSILIAVLSAVTTVSAVDRTSNPKLVADLKSAATALDRQALLTDKDWIFDFTKQEKWTYSPGSKSSSFFHA